MWRVGKHGTAHLVVAKLLQFLVHALKGYVRGGDVEGARAVLAGGGRVIPLDFCCQKTGQLWGQLLMC